MGSCRRLSASCGTGCRTGDAAGYGGPGLLRCPLPDRICRKGTLIQYPESGKIKDTILTRKDTETGTMSRPMKEETLLEEHR